MPEMTRYEHGVPSWVDIGTPDPGAGVRFYSQLFGWDGQDMDEEAGHYTIVSKGGKQVAAISPAQDPGPPRWTTSRRPDMPAGVPDSWLVYFGAADVDADVQKAAGLGASVIAAPSDIPGTGRFAVLTDPQGAAFALYKG